MEKNDYRKLMDVRMDEIVKLYEMDDNDLFITHLIMLIIVSQFRHIPPKTMAKYFRYMSATIETHAEVLDK